MNDPDSGLVREARNGDKASFGKLVTHYFEMVYGLAYGVLGEHEVARDVAQEVFLKVYGELAHFEGKSKFKTWLYRIAINAAIDQGRKKKHTDSLDATDASDDDEAPLVIEDHQPNPRDRAAQEELSGIVGRALEGLSPEHRLVLTLREWQGLSYEEIAESLGVEIGTVMSRIFYARKRLAEILAPMMKVKK